MGLCLRSQQSLVGLYLICDSLLYSYNTAVANLVPEPRYGTWNSHRRRPMHPRFLECSGRSVRWSIRLYATGSIYDEIYCDAITAAKVHIRCRNGQLMGHTDNVHTSSHTVTTVNLPDGMVCLGTCTSAMLSGFYMHLMNSY